MAITDTDLQEYAFRIGQQIRSLRKAKGLTQSTLAELAELNGKFLGTVERGETTLTVSRLLRLAAALEVPVTTIIEPAGSFHSTKVSKKDIISLITTNLHKLSASDLLALYRYSAFLQAGSDDTPEEDINRR